MVQQTLIKSISKSDSTATSKVSSVDKRASAKKVDNRQENSEEDDEIKKQVKFKTNLISPATDSKYIHRTHPKRIHGSGSNKMRYTSEHEEGSEESIIGNSDDQHGEVDRSVTLAALQAYLTKTIVREFEVPNDVCYNLKLDRMTVAR
jgi:hypothetical protein